MSNEKLDTLNILMLGDPGVGKTQLLKRFNRTGFNEEYYPTKGEESGTNRVKVNSEECHLKLMDTAGGAEHVAQLSQAHVVFIMFSVIDNTSYLNIIKYIQQSKTYGSNPKMYLVGTKADLSKERRVTHKQAEEFAQSMNIDYFEISAKNNSSDIATLFNIAGVEAYSKKTKEGLSGIADKALNKIMRKIEEEVSRNSNPYNLGFWGSRVLNVDSHKARIPTPIKKIYEICSLALDEEGLLTSKEACAKIARILKSEIRSGEQLSGWDKVVRFIRNLLARLHLGIRQERRNEIYQPFSDVLAGPSR